MFAALFANGGPAQHPTAASSLSEWLVWGALMTAAALLAGWAVLNRKHPSRDIAAGFAMLLALGLVITATSASVNFSHKRQQEQRLREAREAERVNPPE